MLLTVAAVAMSITCCLAIHLPCSVLKYQDWVWSVVARGGMLLVASGPEVHVHDLPTGKVVRKVSCAVWMPWTTLHKRVHACAVPRRICPWRCCLVSVSRLCKPPWHVVLAAYAFAVPEPA